jgi:hypothetical protein
MYPFILEEKTYSLIIALSDTEIGKVILPSTLVWVNAETGEKVDNVFGEGEAPTLQKEVDALVFANKINGLLPTFIRTDKWQKDDSSILDMIVMERLYSLPIHHFDLETRKTMFDVFESKMEELHRNFFAHGDFCRPTNFFTRNNYEWIFQNIIQTEQGLRLVDTGFSRYILRDKNDFLIPTLIDEKREIPFFKEYYFGNIKSTFPKI